MILTLDTKVILCEVGQLMKWTVPDDKYLALVRGHGLPNSGGYGLMKYPFALHRWQMILPVSLRYPELRQPSFKENLSENLEWFLQTDLRFVNLQNNYNLGGVRCSLRPQTADREPQKTAVKRLSRQ